MSSFTGNVKHALNALFVATLETPRQTGVFTLALLHLACDGNGAKCLFYMEEAVGFEPTERFHVR